MTTLRDKSSNSFILSLIAFKIPKDVVARKIYEYNRVSDPFWHINRHKVFLLGNSRDEHHIALLFTSSLSGIALLSFTRALIAEKCCRPK